MTDLVQLAAEHDLTTDETQAAFALGYALGQASPCKHEQAVEDSLAALGTFQVAARQAGIINVELPDEPR